MSSILSRIAKIADKEGISITALERNIGASKGVLSRAINNNTDIQTKWLEILIENYPRYNVEWLMTGKGEMMSNQQYKTSEKDKKDEANEPETEYINYKDQYIEQLKSENERLVKYSSYLENTLREKDDIINSIKSGEIIAIDGELRKVDKK